ncbi:DUF1566 domain-containing protein [Candidatus Marithrix sp. Canyon 246]|uniref:DUF1566 domain-containing protein n=1 Tax=Candidatus Marithrix sp. Canyon 246 TaxID=1827136 RepID=UPI00084A13F4|nr:DUF1566 domain-containing protein [Candidatus Marithrix sp. Canyon 246]
MIRYLIITIFLLPSLWLNVVACPIMSQSEKQEKFVNLFNKRLQKNLTFEELQQKEVIELSTSHRWNFDNCNAELFEYFGRKSANTKYINVSSIYFKFRSYRTLVKTLNSINHGINDKLHYVFALDKFSFTKPTHYKLIENNDYGWCNTINPDWLKHKRLYSECKITEAVPVCQIDMTDLPLDQLINNIKSKCGSAKLVHITNLNDRVSENALNFSDDLPVKTVYLEGPANIKFNTLTNNQTAITLSANKKLYLKGITLSGNNGIGIHVKAGELRLQGATIEGFDYGVISEKDTSFYAWDQKIGYKKGIKTRIIANNTGVKLYQAKEPVVVNTEADIRVINNPSDLVRHYLWLQGDNSRFAKIDDCVYDRKTGLIWKSFSSSFKFDEVQETAEQTNLCELTNWRLPTIEELYWLAERSTDKPAIEKEFFPNIYFDNKDYWSSTKVLNQLDKVWTVNFRYGIDNHQSKNKKQRLILVSGESPFSFKKLEDSNCFEDTQTKLTWLNQGIATKWFKDKSEFVKKANKQKKCGYSDWRLPKAETLYLLANRSSKYDKIIADGNYWFQWPNKKMFYMGSLSFPEGKQNAQTKIPYEAYLLLVRGKLVNFGEAAP